MAGSSKLERLWATKNPDDEWWSSFVTSPAAILINWVVVEWRWLSPNLITLFSLVTAITASVLIVVGGSTNFLCAAGLIQLSHVLDCMDGQMAKYRGASSRFGDYFDKVTDQFQVFVWFSALAYAAYLQTQSVTPVFLAFVGVSFYSLRVYVKYVTIFIQVRHDRDYLEKSSERAVSARAGESQRAGLGSGWKVNLVWLLREQRKFLLFNETVFVFLLSAALLTGQLVPMLWLFASSQVYFGFARSWQRGRQIHLNQQADLWKPMEK
ncbi:MAG: CDP-alcohol phosphatidyltransferase family protein [Planctomycetota bacterium]|nr:MAG: CDP-alcohol phosphatidyltransferase family protein [Planctomycetota bacterium]